VAVGRTLARRGGALGLDGRCAMDAHRGLFGLPTTHRHREQRGLTL